MLFILDYTLSGIAAATPATLRITAEALVLSDNCRNFTAKETTA